VPQSQILFSANRYVSNGKGPDITHIVYVDPEGYSQLADLSELRDVGRAVSSLNKILPKRQFILMGPGRWGSRGDIKLGVSVTYSDISNTNMLIEIARKQGNYMPDLSFGTHFFQDLVEFQIRYLPLYPDDARVIFKESFFKQAHNMLSDLLPEYADLAHTVYVIDVPRNSGGKVLRVLMNADLDEAVGILTSPGPPETSTAIRSSAGARPSEDHSRWRARMAEHIAENIDRNSMGVKGLYLIGSTKNTTAGPDADIDLIVHFCGTPQMKHDLEMWLDGWSLCLAEMNFLRTGVSKEVLLDVRFVTDEDIAQQTSFAAKIDAVTDAARSLL
jgi:predicted nucleotidyltransferase